MDIFSIVLAKAAREFGSPAARDYDLASGGDGGFTNAIYELAAERAGAGATTDQKVAADAALRAELHDEIQAHVATAKSRRYTGWSQGGVIRYADEEA